MCVWKGKKAGGQAVGQAGRQDVTVPLTDRYDSLASKCNSLSWMFSTNATGSFATAVADVIDMRLLGPPTAARQKDAGNACLLAEAGAADELRQVLRTAGSAAEGVGVPDLRAAELYLDGVLHCSEYC